MRFLMIAMMFVLTVFLSACAATQQAVSPFKIEKEKFADKINTIAVIPTEIPSKTALNPASAQAAFDNLIESRLKGSGYKVIHLSEYNAIREKVQKEVGGYFDVNTGALDKEKYQTFLRRIDEEIIAAYHPDAIMRPYILFVDVDFVSPAATWDEVTEATEDVGVTFAKAAGGSYDRGVLPALSLYITLYDADDHRLIYEKRGGIQLLSRQVAFKGYQRIPDEKILTSKNKNTDAVQIALKDMLVQKAKK